MVAAAKNLQTVIDQHFKGKSLSPQRAAGVATSDQLIQEAYSSRGGPSGLNLKKIHELLLRSSQYHHAPTTIG